ncbi:lipase [Listeria sp. ILCC792]|uniref:lipase n=1 Tax=Listeria sp. ILCC792 TaxID=1918331 RepID=UPI000B58A7DA|nr:lipase [Listeria sp. ILCC792]
MISDKQYKGLSDSVYWLDPEHENYAPDMKQGNAFDYKGSTYKILKTEDNQKNGMQAMAVSPVDKNGNIDTTEVVIAYAGTNFSDELDRNTDLETVIKGEEKLDQDPLNPFKNKEVDGQAITAREFADGVKADYPNAKITTTGHSLGEYLALTVAAENKWQNVGVNGPDPSNILSDEAKMWIEENPGMLTNYRNRADTIGNYGSNGTGAEIKVSMEMGARLNPIDYHQLSNWKFDKDGKLKIPNNEYNKEAIIQQAERYVMAEYTAKLYAIEVMRKKFQASGEAISANEQIYLDDSQSLAVVETSVAEFRTVTSNVIKVYQDAMDEAENLWKETLRQSRQMADLLTESEILEELSNVGCTEQKLVIEPCEKYQRKIEKVKKMGVKFDKLAEEIKVSIETLLQKDYELAQQLG